MCYYIAYPVLGDLNFRFKDNPVERSDPGITHLSVSSGVGSYVNRFHRRDIRANARAVADVHLLRSGRGIVRVSASTQESCTTLADRHDSGDRSNDSAHRVRRGVGDSDDDVSAH